MFNSIDLLPLAENFRQERCLGSRQKGRREAILSNLNIRLGSVPQGLTQSLHQDAELERLNNLQRASVAFVSFEEFAKAL